ncbi:rieske [2Fe-2S] domain-containing protein [Sarocladium implicatum]|nr:rieske [2Fe-2S] domain-containing protein [Sarocladium implicatum]
MNHRSRIANSKTSTHPQDTPKTLTHAHPPVGYAKDPDTMNPFTFFKRPTEAWFYAGPASSFPDIDPEVDDADLSQPRPSSCTESGRVPGCKTFNVSREDGSKGVEVPVQSGALEWDEDGESEQELKDQVLVFRYKGRFHAVDHKCPHASFPLSKATPFDIEDFGVALSAGLMCPKHSWSFDIWTGMSDRAAYRLAIWEVQHRDDGGVWDLIRENHAADKGRRARRHRGHLGLPPWRSRRQHRGAETYFDDIVSSLYTLSDDDNDFAFRDR